MEMVRGLVDTLEKHHNVLILDEAVRAAVQLSHRYIPARQLPDKAISLLDTAAARVALTLHTPPASVQFLRQQLKAAEMERSLLQKQEKMGIQSDERRDALTARIFSLNNELTASESRWQRELELVHTLQELRVAESDADDKTTLQQAETALREWQGDAPVVFPEVSAAVVAAIVADWTGIPAGRMVKDEASRCWNCLPDWRNALPGKTARWRRLVNVFRPPWRDWAIHANRWACLCWPGRPVSVKPKPRWRWRRLSTAVSRTR